MLSRYSLAAAAIAAALASPAHADKLDDIIVSGKLRCAVMLDFAPMGLGACTSHLGAAASNVRGSSSASTYSSPRGPSAITWVT